MKEWRENIRLVSPFFWLCASLFLLNQWLEVYVSLPFIHAYLDDLVAPGIVLGLSLYFFRFVFPGDRSFVLPPRWGLIFVLWYSLLYEVIFPAYDARHYADVWDVLAYAIGTLAFYRWGQKWGLPAKRVPA